MSQARNQTKQSLAEPDQFSADRPTVHVVDDDDAVRDALCALLTSVAVDVRAYDSALAFLEVAHADMTGCVVSDVRMPGMSGLDLQQSLNERGIHLPVILITGHGDIPMAVRAMKAGAVDFLVKPFNEQELLDRVQASIASHAQIRLESEIKRQAAQRFANLTPREREVLARIVDGNHSKAIAYSLGISERTVDVHRFNIMRKAGVRNLPELMQVWMQIGDAEETVLPE